MADFSNDKSEAPIAVSADLAKRNIAVSSSDLKADLSIIRQMTSSSDKITREIFDSNSPVSIGSAQDKVGRAPGEANLNGMSLALLETTTANGLRTPSSFAQRVDSGLRNGDMSKVFEPYNPSRNSAKDTVKSEAKPSVKESVAPKPEPDFEQSDVTQPIRTVHIDVSHIPKEPVKPEVKPKPVEHKVVDKLKDYQSWKEFHAGKMSEYEMRFTWLVNDVRMHPEKYKDLTNRTRALPPLSFNTVLKNDAKANSVLVNNSHVSGHYTDKGRAEIAFYIPGSADAALKGFMRSSGHKQLIEGNYKKFGASRVGSGLTMCFA